MIGALDVRGAFYSLLLNPGVAPVSPRRTLEVAAEVESRNKLPSGGPLR